jgi:hypothetical protein
MIEMARRGRLGEIMQDAMANGGAEMAPPRPATRRGPAAYVVGAIGAGFVCAGALLLLVVMMSPASSMSGGALKGGAALMFGGAVVLGAGWIATLGTGHGGLVAVVASFAVPAGIIYFQQHLRDSYEQETTVAIMGAALAVFAGGHVVARGVHRGVRAIAAIAMVAVIVAFAAEAQHWHIEPRRLGHLYSVAFFALAATGLVLAINLGALAKAAPRS